MSQAVLPCLLARCSGRGEGEEKRGGRWRRGEPTAEQQKPATVEAPLPSPGTSESKTRVEKRAKGVAAEVNGLLDEAAVLELDVKTAVVSFDNLTRQRFTEHASRENFR